MVVKTRTLHRSCFEWSAARREIRYYRTVIVDSLLCVSFHFCFCFRWGEYLDSLEGDAGNAGNDMVLSCWPLVEWDLVCGSRCSYECTPYDTYGYKRAAERKNGIMWSAIWVFYLVFEFVCFVFCVCLGILFNSFCLFLFGRQFKSQEIRIFSIVLHGFPARMPDLLQFQKCRILVPMATPFEKKLVDGSDVTVSCRKNATVKNTARCKYTATSGKLLTIQP